MVMNLAHQIFQLHYGFLFDSIIELPKLIGIKNRAINLIESKQILYNLIYSLRLVELKTLRTYINN